MLSLPTVEIAGQASRFPITDRCAREILQVVARSLHPSVSSATAQRSAEMILASCPATMCWAMQQSVDAVERPIRFSALAKWFSRAGVDALQASSAQAESTNGCPVCIHQKSSRRLYKFCRAAMHGDDSNPLDRPAVKKKLAKFVGSITPLTAETATVWLDELELSPDFWQEYRSVLHREGFSPDQLASEWESAADQPVAGLSALMAIGSIESNAKPDDAQEFQRQLHQHKMAAMKQLAYGASHEINNPLANIASRAQTLLRDEHDPERRRKLESINQQAFRAHEMIADMMLFAHPPQPDLQATDASVVITEVIEEMRTLSDQCGGQVIYRGQQCPAVRADATQLAVALKALVQNALESQPEPVTVEIELVDDPADSVAVLRVMDDGPGISADHIDHLFDPFFSGREAGRGLGFGLCKAWRIAELHGGELTAQNRSHQGALFELRIPYAEAP